LYYTQKFSKEGIYGSLTVDKNVEKKLALAIENAIIVNLLLNRIQQGKAELPES